MSTRFVAVDRNQALLLPPDLRDWVGEDDLVHFVIAAVESLPPEQFKVNVRGTGSAQYPPSMMLALLIYCYANGIFSSRRIERATSRDIAVRFLTADTHPDHDTIAAFRRENSDVVKACFVHVLELARELKLLRVGTVSVDGTKLNASASKNRNVRYDRAGQLAEQLELEVKELIEKAEKTDREETADPQQLPKELSRANKLKEKVDAAKKRLEERARKRAAAEQADYDRKVKERDARCGSAKGCHIKPPDPAPRPDEQENLTDPDSRLMRKNKHSSYEQAYNAQAAVDAEGSQLIVSARISQCASDRNELEPTVRAIPQSIGTPTTVLADNGYCCEAQVRALEGNGTTPAIEVLVSVHAEAQHLRRKHDFRPLPTQTKTAEQTDQAPPKIRSEFILEMKQKMEQPAAREKYKLRKQTVEPVFGTLKKWMGFTQFNLRGIENVTNEWNLIALAYNLKRLHTLQRNTTAPQKQDTATQKQDATAQHHPAQSPTPLISLAITHLIRWCHPKRRQLHHPPWTPSLRLAIA